MSIFTRVRETIVFYRNGCSKLIEETKKSAHLKKSMQHGVTLTRDDHRLIYRNAADFRKMVPFFLLLAILPESIPFLLLRGSNIIPSTCITADQAVLSYSLTKDETTTK
jgi:LETM1 and EF-hand domain-containing protein 1